MIIGRRVAVNFREQYFGTLVAFGVGYEELRDGIGHYTEAVIMNDDGELCTCPVNCVTVIK